MEGVLVEFHVLFVFEWGQVRRVDDSGVVHRIHIIGELFTLLLVTNMQALGKLLEKKQP